MGTLYRSTFFLPQLIQFIQFSESIMIQGFYSPRPSDSQSSQSEEASKTMPFTTTHWDNCTCASCTYLRGQKKDDAGQHGAKSNTPINPQTDYFQNSRYPPRRSQCQREGASDTFISRQKTKIIIGLVA